MGQRSIELHRLLKIRRTNAFFSSFSVLSFLISAFFWLFFISVLLSFNSLCFLFRWRRYSFFFFFLGVWWWRTKKKRTSLFRCLVFIPTSLQLIAPNTSRKSIKTLLGPATTSAVQLELLHRWAEWAAARLYHPRVPTSLWDRSRPSWNTKMTVSSLRWRKGKYAAHLVALRFPLLTFHSVWF